MGFRVTQNLSAEFARRQVQDTFARYFEAQQVVGSGKKVSRPSDDPSGISRLLFYKERSKELEQFGKNASEGLAVVDTGASVLQDASSRIIDARSLIVQGLNGGLDPSARQTVADEIDGILQDLLALGNSKVGNRWIFGGTATDAPPFSLVTDPSGQQRAVYHGNDDSQISEVGPGLSTPVNVPGSRIFRSTDRGATTFLGSTGALPGSGTDSGVGSDELVIAHTTTTYAGGGLSAGASSAAGDTVIGNHTVQLSVDPFGSSGTISLNGGPAVGFTNPATDLEVTGPNGEKIHVDLTGVTPSFNSTVTLTGNGTLSTDGGATTVAIDTSRSNQQVVDSYTQAVLNVDPRNISRVGVEKVSYTGSFGLYESLIAIRDGLRNAGQSGNTLDQDLDRVRAHLDEFDAAHEQLLQGLGQLGGISGRLRSAETRVGDLDVRLQDLVSKGEDADLSEAVIDLNRTQTAYQSALLVTARVNQLSLLDYV